MRAYLDHNATSPLRPEARERWLEVKDALGGNPSSLHEAGRRARAWIDEARERVAAALAVGESEVVFTSGGTEANNLALWGAAEAAGPESGVVTTAVEHSSILEPARALERRGHPLTRIGVDETGLPDLESLLEAARRPGIGVVSVMAANNEVGTLPDLAGIASALGAGHPERPTLHTDAVQALGRIPVRPSEWGVDLASFSAHKLGGPPGIGVLWRRTGTTLQPLFHGGGQEEGLRPGTEDAAGIAAAAVAIELAVAEQEELAQRAHELVGFLWHELSRAIPELVLVGPPLDAPARLPNTLCLLLPGTDGKVLVTRLDLEGLQASAGSACASGALEPSHVLQAMGWDEDAARSGLRLSVGWNTSREECEHAAHVLRKLFAMSRAT